MKQKNKNLEKIYDLKEFFSSEYSYDLENTQILMAFATFCSSDFVDQILDALKTDLIREIEEDYDPPLKGVECQ
jgi:hypothetical protein